MSSAAALPKGTPIGPHGAFRGFATLVDAEGTFVYGFFGVGGPWADVPGAYLGLQFYLDGQAHYGWAELSLSAFAGRGTAGLAGEITAFAYDTVANQGLDAGQTSSTPEPDTLSLLALGSLGLGLWRRRKAVGS